MRMEAYIVETPVGVFIFDDQTKNLEAGLFSSEPRNAAIALKQLQDGKLNQPLIDAVNRAAKSYSPVVFENEKLAKAVENEAKITISIRSSPVADQLRTRLGSEWKGREKWSSSIRWNHRS